MINKVLAILMLFSSTLSFAQDYQRYVRDFVSKPYFVQGRVGIVIKDLSHSRLLVDYNSDKFLIPASVQKILTTFASLDIFGPSYRFHTNLGYNGVIKDSILYGDLIIKGYGDPTTGSENFDDTMFLSSFVEAVKKAGIKQIKGNIVADASYFDPLPTPAKWTWEDLGNYYGAAPTALCIYDNTYRLVMRTFSPGQPARIITIVPQIPGLKLHSYVRSAYIRSDQSYIIGSPGCMERSIVGRLPAHRKEFIVKGAIPDPPLFFAQLIREALDTAGIIIEGKACTARADTMVNLFTLYSPSLLQIIQLTNHKSVNLYAEVLLKHLALKYADTADTRTGITALYNFWASRGVDTSQMILYDGSGLSRYNVLTPGLMASVLESIYHSRNFDNFLTSLPVAGNSGTLKYIGRRTLLQDHFYAKSGSMRRVRNYAGYFFDKKGNVYSVVIMLNDFTCSQAVARREIVNFLTTIFRND